MSVVRTYVLPDLGRPNLLVESTIDLVSDFFGEIKQDSHRFLMHYVKAAHVVCTERINDSVDSVRGEPNCSRNQKLTSNERPELPGGHDSTLPFAECVTNLGQQRDDRAELLVQRPDRVDHESASKSPIPAVPPRHRDFSLCSSGYRPALNLLERAA